jgi:hypothetical protein
MKEDTIDLNFWVKDIGHIPGDDHPFGVARRETCRMADREGRSASDARPLRILAINTCPRKNNGNIAIMLLDPFLEGARESGADVELYYSRDLTIFPCCGNLNCTVRTPGNCMAYDDMRWLRQNIGRADVLVLASPLYFNGIIGPEGATMSLKSLLGRLAPGKLPSTEVPYEHAVHTTREAVSLRKIVFASGCGFWEIDDFYPVLTHIKALCYNTFPEFASNIVETHGVLLSGALEGGASAAEVAEIAKEAGRHLVRSPSADPIAREGLTREKYRLIMGELDNKA